MKRFFSFITFLMLLLATKAETVTLWENTKGFNPGWWNKQKIEAKKFADAKVGDKLVLTIKTEDWGCYITLGSADGTVKYYESNDDDPSKEGIFGRGLYASAKENYMDFNVPILPELLPLLKEKGLSIGGGSFVMTKVSIKEVRLFNDIVPQSPKLRKSYNNPLVDFKFIADPTAIEYNGRLYVYGTNDSQQYTFEESGYEYINTLCMLSTDDMVNWTYHGDIPVKKIMTGCGSSWAPSIVSRIEDDGLTHFYLYYAHNGGVTNVLTATSPIGPWTAPLGNNKVFDDGSRYGCTFDPGAVIDNNGQGWIAVGGGQGLLFKLNDDMISYDPKNVLNLHPQYHMEANEMNMIGGKYVYTYNINWSSPFENWTGTSEKPTTCCMYYMVSDDPLNPDSWKYENNYLKNPGEYGFRWGNNHTHLQKFGNKYYIIYHTCMLNDDSWNLPNGTDEPGMGTGFRSLMINEINVDEKNVKISMGKMTKQGVRQLKALNPYEEQQAETTAATEGIVFEQSDIIGNMLAKPGKAFERHGMPEKSIILVRKVNFGAGSTTFSASVKGQGILKIYAGNADTEPVGIMNINSNDWVDEQVECKIKGVQNLIFTLEGNILFDKWIFSDNSTGIEQMMNTDKGDSGSAYNVMGIKVDSDSTHGIIIKNGIKIINHKN